MTHFPFFNSRAKVPLLRGDPIFGVRGAVFGVRAVSGAGGAVLGVTGERASSRWWWKHGRNDRWEVWKKDEKGMQCQGHFGLLNSARISGFAMKNN